jgi:SNF2 family DNA or RNA helicase
MTKFNLPDDLYAYQKDDSDKMSQDTNWLNFSEMGVGKTPEALAVVEKMGYKFPLILCPNSLRLEWERQITDWVGEGMTAISTPDCYQRLGPIIYSYQNNIKYKVINYETLRNDRHMELLNLLPFDIVIMDEVHKLRNPNTKMVRGSMDKLTREYHSGVWDFVRNHPDSKYLCLSGSPIMNYPNDLYVPLSIVRPQDYPMDIKRWKDFMYTYCLWSQGKFGSYIYGTQRMNELRAKTAPYTIRRTKKEVLPFLPEKYYRRVMLDMPPEQRKLYDQMESELRILLDTGETLSSPSVLSTLTRLRQMNLDPKIVGVTSPSAKTEFLMDLVESTDNKIVIFSCFEAYIYLLSQIFLKDVPHVCVTGKIPSDKRSVEVKKFQEDPNIKLFLGTIQTAGEGLTLTAANIIVFTDRWWNTPSNTQAEDRCHRIGQTSGVEVIILVCNKSVDAIIDSILERKNEMSQSYYSENQVTQTAIQEMFH